MTTALPVGSSPVGALCGLKENIRSKYYEGLCVAESSGVVMCQPKCSCPHRRGMLEADPTFTGTTPLSHILFDNVPGHPSMITGFVAADMSVRPT